MYIEDDANIHHNVAKTLNLIFKKVTIFENAEDALLAYKKSKPDLILSDINLPNMNGIEFSQEIRKEDTTIPIILLTAYTNKKILLEATRLKLTNYIVKPVVFEELYHSFQMALDDIKQIDVENIVFFSQGLSYNKLTKLLYDNSIEIHLTASEHRLLELFLENIGKTLSSLEIKEHIWNDSYYATDAALKSLLSKLRSKIGKNSIKNVSGIGYYLVAYS